MCWGRSFIKKRKGEVGCSFISDYEFRGWVNEDFKFNVEILIMINFLIDVTFCKIFLRIR